MVVHLCAVCAPSSRVMNYTYMVTNALVCSVPIESHTASLYILDVCLPMMSRVMCGTMHLRAIVAKLPTLTTLILRKLDEVNIKGRHQRVWCYYSITGTGSRSVVHAWCMMWQSRPCGRKRLAAAGQEEHHSFFSFSFFVHPPCI